MGGKEKLKEIVKGSNDEFEKNYNDWRIKNLIFLQLKVNKLKTESKEESITYQQNVGKECRKGMQEWNVGKECRVVNFVLWFLKTPEGTSI